MGKGNFLSSIISPACHYNVRRGRLTYLYCNPVPNLELENKANVERRGTSLY